MQIYKTLEQKKRTVFRGKMRNLDSCIKYDFYARIANKNYVLCCLYSNITALKFP